jgi:hypothetical protein
MAFTSERLAVEVKMAAIAEVQAKLDRIVEDSKWLNQSDEAFRDHIVTQWQPRPLEWDAGRAAALDKDEVWIIGKPVPAGSGPDVYRLYLPLVPKSTNGETLLIRPEGGWDERGPSLAAAAAFDPHDHTIMLRGTKGNSLRCGLLRT